MHSGQIYAKSLKMHMAMVYYGSDLELGFSYDCNILRKQYMTICLQEPSFPSCCCNGHHLPGIGIALSLQLLNGAQAHGVGQQLINLQVKHTVEIPADAPQHVETSQKMHEGVLQAA